MLPLQEIYIGCTIFSVGVTALDFLGVLGGNEDGESGDGDDAGDLDVDSADGDGGMDVADLDGGHSDSGDGDHDGSGTKATTHHSGGGGVAVLSVLSYLRSLLYFCLGFGPTGWVALATGIPATQSLMWAVPAGGVSFIMARAFFRFQRSDTDSSLQFGDLLFRRATVLIPLSHRTMGKVRVQVGMNVSEQYALATDPEAEFKKGDTVYITDVTAECVYVEDQLVRKELTR